MKAKKMFDSFPGKVTETINQLSNFQFSLKQLVDLLTSCFSSIY